jgi:hypothetical protein
MKDVYLTVQSSPQVVKQLDEGSKATSNKLPKGDSHTKNKIHYRRIVHTVIFCFERFFGEKFKKTLSGLFPRPK